VQSKILAISSKVFKTLLSPRFREGTDLTLTGTVETPLPDDDPDAMIVICNILHLRNDEVAISGTTVEQLLTIATWTDKYDCSRAMRHATELWIRKLTKATVDNEWVSQYSCIALSGREKARSAEVKTSNNHELHSLLAATFYFQHEPMWQHVSKAFVLESKASLGPLEGFHHPQYLEDLCSVSSFFGFLSR